VIPLWARSLLLIDALLSGIGRVLAMLRDELLLAGLSSRQIDSLNESFYQRNTCYLPEGTIFRAGLFDWERQALEQEPFPRTGHLLIGGGGGGREMKELAARGYRVTAFEPAAVLAAAAAALAATIPQSRFVRASYADLVQAAEGRQSPLSEAMADAHFDGVYLGWGSFPHLVRYDDRIRLLRALRQVAPGAPVLMSFLRLENAPPPGRVDRMRASVRAFLGSAKADPPSGGPHGATGFLPRGGFVYRFVPGEIESLVAEAGFEIAWIDWGQFPWAVLRPD
jgi:hypothetical protein